MNYQLVFVIFHILMFGILKSSPTLVLPLLWIKNLLKGKERGYDTAGQQTQPLTGSGKPLNSMFSRNSDFPENSELPGNSEEYGSMNRKTSPSILDFERNSEEYQEKSGHSSNLECQNIVKECLGNAKYSSDLKLQKSLKHLPMASHPLSMSFPRDSKEFEDNLDPSTSSGIQSISNRYPLVLKCCMDSQPQTSSAPLSGIQTQRNSEYPTNSNNHTAGSGYSSKSRFSFNIGHPKNNDNTQSRSGLLGMLGISLSYDRESSLKLG